MSDGVVIKHFDGVGDLWTFTCPRCHTTGASANRDEIVQMSLHCKFCDLKLRRNVKSVVQ